MPSIQHMMQQPGSLRQGHTMPPATVARGLDIPLAWILVQGIGPHTCHGTYVKLENERLGVQYLGAQQGCLAAGRDVLPKAVRTAIVE